MLVLRHGQPRRSWLAAPLLREAPPGAEPLGAHRRQLPGSARLAENFLEGRGKQLEEATQADLEDFLGDILPRRSANTAATRYKVLPCPVSLAGGGRGAPQPDGAHEAALACEPGASSRIGPSTWPSTR